MTNSTLSTLLSQQPSFLEGKSASQIVSMCADGKIRDDSETSREFRDYLSKIQLAQLARYASDCLDSPFDASGLVLQDLVNQLGSRLGYDVSYGRYRGVRNKIGHDGLWRSADGHAIVVEVKTTDTYRIAVETIAKYRQELIRAGSINGDSSSILIVVGREDTGELEAQVRGSRYAWDTRIISVESLFRLARTREALDNPATSRTISSLLKPREYTRLDPIVELVFQATLDAEEAQEDEAAEPKANGIESSEIDPNRLRDLAIKRLHHHLERPLIKQSRTTYLTADGKIAVICKPSKRYERGRGNWYWFTFSDSYRAALDGAEQGYLCLVCGNVDRTLLIPRDALYALLPGMRATNGRHQIELDWSERSVRLDAPASDLSRFILEGP